ncbi:MAG: host attachment protein [Noviherbaspirillum sp.]
MQTNWILVADSSRARIFEREGLQQPLREVQDFNNSPGHAAADELRTDNTGRFVGRSDRTQGHTSEPATTPVQHENELFAISLAQFLDKAHEEQRYGGLCLIAPPKFLGLLHKHLKKNVLKTVEDELPKDISKFTPQEIETYIREKIDAA